MVAPLQGCYPGREIPTPAECAAASQALGLRFSRAYTSPRYARNCWANFANGAYFNYLQGRAPHTDGATREVCCARESSFIVFHLLKLNSASRILAQSSR